MTDNQLFTLIRSVLLAGLEASDIPGAWRVARSFQPEQNGANSEPTVYVFKLNDKRVGSPWAKYEWNTAEQRMDALDERVYMTTFQASVLMDETTDPAALTPGDVAVELAAIMQSDEALAALRAECVGIVRVGDSANPYDANDRGRFQASPSFDFVLSHRRRRNYVAPHATSIEGAIHRV
jgi:hypothetical protein